MTILNRPLLVPERPGQLDGGLVGLGAAVAKETLAAERPLRQSLGKRTLGLHVPGIRHVDQLPDLVAHRLDDARRAMPQEVTAPPRKEIQIPVALGVPDPRPFAPDQADRVTPIIGNHVSLELRDRRLRTLTGKLRRRQGCVSLRNLVVRIYDRGSLVDY